MSKNLTPEITQVIYNIFFERSIESDTLTYISKTVFQQLTKPIGPEKALALTWWCHLPNSARDAQCPECQRNWPCSTAKATVSQLFHTEWNTAEKMWHRAIEKDPGYPFKKEQRFW